MDIAALASAIIGAKIAEVQLAVAAKLAKMNAQQGESVAKLLDAAQANLGRLANVAAGIGTSVDLSV